MDKNLNELSALYMQNIAEQGPEEQQQRVTQIVKAIRYRARKEGVELARELVASREPARVLHEYARLTEVSQ